MLKPNLLIYYYLVHTYRNDKVLNFRWAYSLSKHLIESIVIDCKWHLNQLPPSHHSYTESPHRDFNIRYLIRYYFYIFNNDRGIIIQICVYYYLVGTGGKVRVEADIPPYFLLSDLLCDLKIKLTDTARVKDKLSLSLLPSALSWLIFSTGKYKGRQDL